MSSIDEMFDKANKTAKEMTKEKICSGCGRKLGKFEIIWSYGIFLKPDGAHHQVEGRCGYCGNIIEKLEDKLFDKEELKE
jgi:hypothetical protein